MAIENKNNSILILITGGARRIYSRPWCTVATIGR